MEKILNNSLKLILYILSLFLLIILIGAIEHVDSTLYFYQIIDNLKIVTCILSIILCLITIKINKYIDVACDKAKKILKLILIATLITGQLAILAIFNTKPYTDEYVLVDLASAYVNNIDEKIDIDYLEYLTKYSNNDFFLVILIVIIKLAKILKITNLTKLFAILNIIFIDIGIYFIYKIAKKTKGENFGLKTLLLNIMNPLNYFYIYWFYTNTTSIAPMYLLIYLFMLFILEKENKTKKYIYIALISIISVIGYFLRATILIPLIAFLIYIFLNNIKKINFKKLTIYILIMIVSSSLTYIGITQTIKSLVREDNNYTFPITHWLMLGLSEDGGVSNEDNRYTLSFPTTKEKNEADIKEIKNRIKNYGFSGLIKHIIMKIEKTWSCGSTNYYVRLSNEADVSKLYTWIAGDKKDFLIIYCQAFRIMTVFLCLYWLINILKNKLNLQDVNNIYMITLFGGILFYILWEGKDAYSYPFIPIILFLCANSLTKIKIESLNKNKYNIPKKLIFTLSIIFIISIYKDLCINKHNYNEYTIFIGNGIKQIAILETEEEYLTQKIYPKKVFDTITLSVGKIKDTEESNDNNNSKYQIELLNNSEIVTTKEITANDIKNSKITLKFNNEYPSENDKYTIKVTKIEDGSDEIKWYYNTYKYPIDRLGYLNINGNNDNGDLSITVYNRTKKPYMNKYFYIFISISFLIIEYLALFELKKKENS